MNKIILGSHVSMSSPDFFHGSVKEALEYGSTTFMFYTGAPQNSYRLPLERLKIQEGMNLLRETNIDINDVIVHAPYIINIANKQNKTLYEISKNNLLNEIKRTAAFNCHILVLHPGSHVGTGFENGFESIVEALDEVLDKDGTNVQIALETMAGKGSEMCSQFEDIKRIIDGVKFKDRVGVCLDTCHISDAGYDIKKTNEVIETFDKVIGLKKLLVIHLNDSKNEIGSHKDRHENIGYGFVGFEPINYIVHDERLKLIPKILETPYIDKKPPYKKEIEMLVNNEFISDWREKF